MERLTKYEPCEGGIPLVIVEDEQSALQRLAAYEDAEEQGLLWLPRWISVTERLPEPKFAREWYLVSLESGCVKSLAFEKGDCTDNLFRHGWHDTASPVTHWMPLPEPPKEG